MCQIVCRGEGVIVSLPSLPLEWTGATPPLELHSLVRHIRELMTEELSHLGVSLLIPWVNLEMSAGLAKATSPTPSLGSSSMPR